MRIFRLGHVGRENEVVHPKVLMKGQISCWNACVDSTTTKVSVICSSYSTLKERIDAIQTVHCSDFDQ